MLWWHWILVGFGLLAIEMLTPGGFFVIFFGVAALLVGGLVAVGAGGPAWLQWLLFSIFSLALMLTLRDRLVRRAAAAGGDGRRLDSLVGETALLSDDLAAGAVGKAELRGSTWSVRSTETRPLPRGLRCTVERVDGLTLWVKPEQGGA